MMKQLGFSQADFDTFSINGLEPRMEAIRSNIQPKFQVIGEELRQDLEAQLGNEVYLHIAQHARRTTNPPADTWLAVAANKRGYKKHPHFQVGLFDDHLFIWLAFIYELPGKQSIAKHFLEHQQSLKETIPAHYMVSLDHTKKKAERFDELDLSSSLERFRDVKKAEWLVGQHFSPDSAVVKDGALLIKEVKQTVNKLLPLYKLAHQSLK